MAHVFFCSRFWCTFEEEDKLKMVRNSEVTVLEGK